MLNWNNRTGEAAGARGGAPSRPNSPLWACVALFALAAAAGTAAEPTDGEAEAEEATDLRALLTEREDENRLKEPLRFELAGRPLFLSGQLEADVDQLEHLELGAEVAGSERLATAQEIETELFFAAGPVLSLFAQLRAVAECEQFSRSADRCDAAHFERGEMWAYFREPFGAGFDIDVGRLNFEDDRLWWWDVDLDALRLSREYSNFELAVAAARELGPARLDRSRIEADEQSVQRWIAEASWDWHANHSLEAFALVHHDRSPREMPGTLIRTEREDEFDTRLHWAGLRASGAWESASGLFGYWLDAGHVSGRERELELESAEEAPGLSVVESVSTRTVDGWAFDIGATWVVSGALQPRITLGYARGSGDRQPDDEHDRAFRQTGLNGNEVGFGGVERFDSYGLLLDPELSNLAVGTVGFGIALLASSSLDLVYHHYRLVHPAEELPESRVALQLDDEHRSLGEALDLILALEEGERFEWYLTASAFRPSRALQFESRGWLTGAQLVGRVAF